MHIDLYDELFSWSTEPLSVLELGGESQLFNDYFVKKKTVDTFTAVIDHVQRPPLETLTTFENTIYKWDYRDKHAVYVMEDLPTAHSIKLEIEKIHPCMCVELISYLMDSETWKDVLVVRHTCTNHSSGTTSTLTRTS
jgi:hypothetical protein